ncbi:uncharacterized protein PV06_01561 [Exophiala oligosperma]|uniref:DNA topoisomerase (ATP-hydrolyzing) n=1 Tax=Exophiala oligosperma TaxID=215243 RepID=A0A0D2DTJ5_9EURO|nr:uncharacterized protein PV06_01561 [Exophiala oligosperma]KIW45850.1 hypothetical protein PV06_01561 [Exophiala oligosperma]
MLKTAKYDITSPEKPRRKHGDSVSGNRMAAGSTDSTSLRWTYLDRDTRSNQERDQSNQEERISLNAEGTITNVSRDIYYHDPDLFKQQETVDRYIDDIAHTFQVTRNDLNVASSPKGLMVGLVTTNGKSHHEKSHTALVPEDLSTEHGFADITYLKWILVFEKEATFKSLAERGYHRNPTVGPGLLVTAKGYPDLSTRRFLRLIVDRAQSAVPIFGLFDWDPDGVQIMKCYRYGSKAMAREQHCNLPEMAWIGLKAKDVVNLGDFDDTSMVLSIRDRTLAVSMLLNRELRDESGSVLPGLAKGLIELRRMLMLNRKAEIQILDERSGGLEHWLTARLSVKLQAHNHAEDDDMLLD